MQAPRSLDEAKALLKAEELKLSTSFHQIIGSRWLMAILATFCLGFGVHALYAPTWLPSLSDVSFLSWGLPSGVDFGVLGDQSKEAVAAAQRQGLGVYLQSLASDHPWLFPAMNTWGFVLSLILLIVNMTIMTMRRKFTRG
ncbi:MAG: hypothetical protein QM759_14890 [Terricaulis sp.]